MTVELTVEKLLELHESVQCLAQRRAIIQVYKLKTHMLYDKKLAYLFSNLEFEHVESFQVLQNIITT
jgi:hypothetical protein